MSTSEKKFEKLLPVYLDSRTPIICVETFDSLSFMEQLKEKCKDEYELIEYRNNNFLYNTFEEKAVSDTTRRELLPVFNEYIKFRNLSGKKKPAVLVLHEIHPLLNQMEIWLKLQEFAQKIQQYSYGKNHEAAYDTRIIIVSSTITLPPELEPLLTMLNYPLPDRAMIQKIIGDFFTRQGEEPGLSVDFMETVKALHGLTEFEIKNILAKAYDAGTVIGKDGINFIYSEKQQIIQKNGLLEMIPVSENDKLAGMHKLRDYIDSFKNIFQYIDLAERQHVPSPNGIMIFGMPGCGKSLSAKYAAQAYNMPLLRMDVGKMLGRYIGESENNLRRAIRAAEAAAPCGLWIDEIEKAFAGVGEQSGAGDVTTRMFGYFLTWMQEKKSAIFIVATANKIENLPPEFLRKGRFDEIFKVNFPSHDEQVEILHAHVKQRCPEIAEQIDYSSVIKKFPADKRDKYSGADLEAVVKEAFKLVFLENFRTFGTEEKKYRLISTEDLQRAASCVAISYDAERYKNLEKSFNDLVAQDASK